MTALALSCQAFQCLHWIFILIGVHCIPVKVPHVSCQQLPWYIGKQPKQKDLLIAIVTAIIANYYSILSMELQSAVLVFPPHCEV